MTRADMQPGRSSIVWLIAALSAGALPHFVYQPFWVFLLYAAMMGWRLMHHFRGWPLPDASRLLKLLHLGTAALALMLVFGHFGLTIGRDAGAALLTVMLAFKVVELRSRRDYYLSCFLGFFLVITNFFYSQSIAMVILMLAVVVLLTSCLLSVNSASAALDARGRLKLSTRMMLQAMPVMVFLFVLFPRIPGPIWGLPQDAATTTTTMTDQITLGDLPPAGQRGVTGSSDNIQLGKISQLIQSDEIAFRVEFADDRFPPQGQRYWRGPVLWKTDGTIWSPLPRHLLKRQTPTASARGPAYRYTMTLEPHNRRWLFALDFPSALPVSLPSHLTADGQLGSDKPIKQRSQYKLVSKTDYRLNPDYEPYLEAALQLPAGKHPRTRELAETWFSEAGTAERYIDKVLAHFNREDFHYTLQPPVLRGDTVDGFLFETRRGFCEHYAASFTVLMRAAGIPARIVTGYLGGDINPVDNILTVRQRDAHAWAEVWLPGQGWLRVDPTAAVSSERIERGMSEMLPAERKTPAIIARSDRMVELWQQVKNNWDAFNSTWDMWIVAYGPARQIELLSRLGMSDPDWRKMVLLLALLLAVTGLLMLLLSYRGRRHADPVVRAYQRFCRRLSRLGVQRQTHEGPRDLARRAETALPAYSSRIRAIIDLYIRLRYGKGNADLADEFIHQVKGFRPRK